MLLIWSGPKFCLVGMGDMSITCWCQHSAVGCLIEDKKSKSKKGHSSEKKMHFELSSLIVWTAPWIVNTIL